MPRTQLQRLFFIGLVALVGIIAFEGVKVLLFPYLTPFQSRLITITCFTILVVLGGYFVFRHIDCLKRQVLEEVAERMRLEAKLSQLNYEFEERVKEDISELARLNVELELEMAKNKQAEEIARASLEQAVEERTHELSTVLEVSKKVASTLELEPLLEVILDQIKAVIPYSGVAIFTMQEGQLEAAAYQIPNQPQQVHPIHLTLSNAGTYREVIQAQNVMIIDDINGDSPLARALYETAEIPLQISFSHARSWIGIPLVVKDRVIGLLSLTHSEPGYYTQQHARLALTIANQVAVAIENARLYEQAHNLAALEERQRIARELHDSVTQLLYGIRLYSTAASHSIRENNLRQVEQDLAEIKENALQALQEMRLLIFELHPPMLKEAGLVAALQTSLDSVEARTGLQTDLKVEAGITRLPTSIEVELFRIAMEALNNLVKYARAKRVTVDLRYTDERVYMDICDNGVGFDLSAAKLSNGLGLRNMEERARRMGANLRITSEPGIGTQVKVDVRIADKVNLN
jgi:signal transduction histidine kinase